MTDQPLYLVEFFLDTGRAVLESRREPALSMRLDDLDVVPEDCARFRFIDRSRPGLPERPDPRWYYPDGIIETRAEIERRKRPDEEALRHNLQSSGLDGVVISRQGRHYPYLQGRDFTYPE